MEMPTSAATELPLPRPAVQADTDVLDPVPEQPEQSDQPGQTEHQEKPEPLRQPEQPNKLADMQQRVNNEKQDGDQFSTRVDKSAGRKRPPQNKVEMEGFFLDGRCDDNELAFAHGVRDARRKPGSTNKGAAKDQARRVADAEGDEKVHVNSDSYKSKMCGFAKSGKCKHGSRCRFAHSAEELRKPAKVQELLQAEDGPANVVAPPPPPTPLPSSFGVRAARERRRQISNWAASYLGEQPLPQAAAGQQRELLSVGRRSNSGAGSSSDMGMWSTDDVDFPNSDESGNRTTSGNSGNSGTGSPGSGSAKQTVRSAGKGVAKPADVDMPTSLLLQNVPTYLTQGSFLSMLEDLTPCMRGNYDFFFSPWDQEVHHNLGFAIVNFTRPEFALEFQRQWSNKEICKGARGHKALKVMRATWQGLQANVEYFTSMELGRASDERFQPLVRQMDGSLQPLTSVQKPLTQSAAAQRAPETPVSYWEQPPMQFHNVPPGPMPLPQDAPRFGPASHWEQPAMSYPSVPPWPYA